MTGNSMIQNMQVLRIPDWWWLVCYLVANNNLHKTDCLARL